MRRLQRESMISPIKLKERETLGSLCIGAATAAAAAVVICCGIAASASVAQRTSRLELSSHYQPWNTQSEARSEARSRRWRFSSQGSNGYNLIVTGRNGGATLVASRAHTAAVYISTRASMDGDGITAKFGHLGMVSVRFESSGRVRVRSSSGTLPGCSVVPRKVVDQLGAFVGEIHFHGEEGFTDVVRNRTTGSVGPTQREICERRSGGNSVSKRAPGHAGQVRPLLRAVAPIGRDLVDFRSGEGAISALAAFGFGANLNAGSLPGVGAEFSVISLEQKQNMDIARLAIARGGSSSLKVDKTLTAATVSPPAPFYGVGYFRSCPLRKWSGSLSVSLPGKKEEALTGQRFLFGGAKLRPEGTCAKPAVG